MQELQRLGVSTQISNQRKSWGSGNGQPRSPAWRQQYLLGCFCYWKKYILLFCESLFMIHFCYFQLITFLPGMKHGHTWWLIWVVNWSIKTQVSRYSFEGDDWQSLCLPWLNNLYKSRKLYASCINTTVQNNSSLSEPRCFEQGSTVLFRSTQPRLQCRPAVSHRQVLPEIACLTSQLVFELIILVVAALQESSRTREGSWDF